jgi:hypothetical protein
MIWRHPDIIVEMFVFPSEIASSPKKQKRHYGQNNGSNASGDSTCNWSVDDENVSDSPKEVSWPVMS